MKIFTFIVLLLPFSLFSQGSLSGKVTDISDQPFGYCKLILLRDSVAIQTVDTDTLGNYSMKNIAEGTYQLHVKVPFKKIDTLITLSGSTVFNLKIDDGNTLKDVEITAKKPMIIRKADRTIFNPADIPALVGGDASDVIEFAPGVYINGNTIEVAGGGPAQVMLNDKLIQLSGSALVSFIQSISTEDIQYIEIIPIPPVKYAATITGSLINIKLVAGAKSRLSKGSITADIGQRFYLQKSISGNYAYRKNKFSLYSNMSLDDSRFRPAGTKIIGFDTLQWNERSTSLNHYLGLSGSLGLNYEINPTTEIGILCFSSRYNDDMTSSNFIRKTNYGDLLYGTINNESKEFNESWRNSATLSLSKRLDTIGKKLDFNVDYTHYDKTKNINYITEINTTNIDSTSKARNKVLTIANFLSGGIDYVHPIKNATLSLGGRYSYTENTNDLSVFSDMNNPDVIDTSKSNVFNYYEHIQAAYLSLDWKFKRWSFQAGLRGENTIYTGDSPTTSFTTENNYFQLVPKLFALYESKNGTTWNFSYSRDFYRPDYSELNPFKYYTSQYSYTIGNPGLKPSVDHSISISTTIKDFQLNLLFHQSVKGSSTVTIFDNATQLQQSTYANLYSAQSISFYTTYFKLINKRISIDATLMTDYSMTRVTEAIAAQQLNNFMAMVSANFIFVLDKRESLSLKGGGFYMTPFYQQITHKTEYPYMFLSMKKNLLKNRISLELYASDPFRLMRTKSITRSNQNIISENYYYDMQMVRFSFTYKLGNNKVNVNQHSTNSTGEAGRAGN